MSLTAIRSARRKRRGPAWPLTVLVAATALLASPMAGAQGFTEPPVRLYGKVIQISWKRCLEVTINLKQHGKIYPLRLDSLFKKGFQRSYQTGVESVSHSWVLG